MNTLEHAAGLLKQCKTTEGVVAKQWFREQERKLENG